MINKLGLTCIFSTIVGALYLPLVSITPIAELYKKFNLEPAFIWDYVPLFFLVLITTRIVSPKKNFLKLLLIGFFCSIISSFVFLIVMLSFAMYDFH